MSKKVGIHQPESFPWAGYFNKMLNSDLFVILDDVQYKKNNFQNRNRIMMNGKATWLTLPIDTKDRLNSTIADTVIADTIDWRSRTIHLLEVAYSKCPYYAEIMPILRDMIANYQGNRLSCFNMMIIKFIRDYLGIDTPMIYSSDIDIDSHKTDLVFDLCKSCEATTYLSGAGGRDYLDLTRFDDNMEVLYQEFYPSHLYKGMTEPYMSVFDIIMSNSKEESLDYIKNAFSFVK